MAERQNSNDSSQLVEGTDFEGHSIFQCTTLFKPLEFYITADHFPVWPRHLAWSKDLRSCITSNMSSNVVVLSLLLNAMLSFLFNFSDIPSQVRRDVYHSQYRSLGYYIGVLVICNNIFVTVYAMLTNFTEWGMVMAIAEENATPPLLRSPLGQYTMQLATRLVLVSLLVLFLVWCNLFVFYILGALMRVSRQVCQECSIFI
jgi:hypothetical protein